MRALIATLHADRPSHAIQMTGTADVHDTRFALVTCTPTLHLLAIKSLPILSLATTCSCHAPHSWIAYVQESMQWHHTGGLGGSSAAEG